MKLRIGYVSRNLTMTLNSRVSSATLSALAALVLLHGCASSSAKPKEEPSTAANPLTGMIGRQLLVLPAQYVAVANAGGSWDIVPGAVGLLPILDEEVEDAFRKRGVKRNWTFAAEITASANRNAGLAGDPRELGAQGIRRVKAGDTPLPEPLASQIRGLVALTNARYALLPLEVRVDTRNSERKASVRMLLIDSRTARVAWAEDVEATTQRDPQAAADALTPYGFRLLSREIAMHFADMVVAQ
ncbi:MAG: hypothetical protein ABI681_13530 [Gemmatimonadales bacterium]